MVCVHCGEGCGRGLCLAERVVAGRGWLLCVRDFEELEGILVCDLFGEIWFVIR